MFWFSYTLLHGRLVIMDVTEVKVRGVRCFTAAYSEDPRIACTDVSPDAAVSRLIAHLEATLTPTHLRVTFAPQAPTAATSHPAPLV